MSSINAQASSSSAVHNQDLNPSTGHQEKDDQPLTSETKTHTTKAEKKHKSKSDSSKSKHKSSSKHLNGDIQEASSSSHKENRRHGHTHGNGHGHSHRHSHSHKEKEKEKSGPFEIRQSRLRLSVPPKFAGDMLVGVKEILDGMVMRYVNQLEGVLLAHWGHELDDQTVGIIGDCPYGVCEVEFQCILWAPKLDQKLVGTHSLSSPSHISLLFSKTFNVSIPLQHIPQELYEFEHTQGADEGDEGSDSDSDSDNEDEDGFGSGAVHEVGRWKIRKNGKILGADGNGIKFTVIGMQVTNQMLSLTGSLLADPHNPPPDQMTNMEAARLDSSPSPTPSRSPSPTRVESSPKKPRKSKSSTQPITSKAAGTYSTSTLEPIPAPPGSQGGGEGEGATATEAQPEIDERFLNPRQLKQLRKEQERAKKEARKARKEEKEVLGVVGQLGGEGMVDVRGNVEIAIPGQSLGSKRKAEGGGGGNKKRNRGD